MLKTTHCSFSKPKLFLMGCALGSLAFLFIYGFIPLDVTQDFWLRGGFVEQDIQQHYAGWLFYRQSPIQIPLGVAKSINWPDGIGILYTDSIPLFAVLFRLAEPLLPVIFQYFGLFTLLCFMLQGGFSALLLSLFLQGPAAILLGSIPLVFSPILVERAFRHTSLAAQFLLLACFYYYFLSHRQNRFCYKGLFVVNMVTITLHPYFVPMTFGVTFAMLLEYTVRNKSIARPAGYLAADLAATVGLGWLFGLFTGTAEGGSAVEYGYFGLNLNALWNPLSRFNTRWSLFLPTQNQTLGNYDSFAYLGLGILLCLVVGVGCILLRRKLADLESCLKRHWAMALVCASLTIFAVSNVVTANGATLFTIPLPHALVRLCTTFRASGRMFWPVYYLLLLFGILVCARLFRRRCVLALALLAVVQLVDLSPALVQRHQLFHNYTAPFPTLLTSDFWQQAGQQYQHLISLDGLQSDPLHLALYAADHQMTTNDPFAARFDEVSLNQQREHEIQKLLDGQIDPHSLYLIQDEGLFLRLADALSPLGIYCARLDNSWYVLAPGMTYLGQDAVLFGPNFPLHMADHCDDYWMDGVLFRAPSPEWEDKVNRTILLPDSDYTRRQLENARALCAEGREYPLIQVDDRDAGWLMVTLDIEDAAVLAEKDLKVVQ